MPKLPSPRTRYCSTRGIGIDGEVGIGQRTADIDVSASEIFDRLEFGAMESYRYESDRWSFQADVIYAFSGR